MHLRLLNPSPYYELMFYMLISNKQYNIYIQEEYPPHISTNMQNSDNVNTKVMKIRLIKQRSIMLESNEKNC